MRATCERRGLNFTTHTAIANGLYTNTQPVGTYSAPKKAPALELVWYGRYSLIQPIEPAVLVVCHGWDSSHRWNRTRDLCIGTQQLARIERARSAESNRARPFYMAAAGPPTARPFAKVRIVRHLADAPPCVYLVHRSSCVDMFVPNVNKKGTHTHIVPAILFLRQSARTASLAPNATAHILASPNVKPIFV